MSQFLTSSSTRIGGRLALVLLATSIFLPWPGEASAQRKRIVFDEDEEGSKVEGYVHRPEVGYIISRQEQEDLETLQLKESFLPKVLKSVEKAPF
jgi:hypothetical protein